MINKISPVSFGTKIEIINNDDFEKARAQYNKVYTSCYMPSLENQVSILADNGTNDTMKIYGKYYQSGVYDLYIEVKDNDKTNGESKGESKSRHGHVSTGFFAFPIESIIKVYHELRSNLDYQNAKNGNSLDATSKDPLEQYYVYNQVDG